MKTDSLASDADSPRSPQAGRPTRDPPKGGPPPAGRPPARALPESAATSPRDARAKLAELPPANLPPAELPAGEVMDERPSAGAEAVAKSPGRIARALRGVGDAWDRRSTPAMLVSLIVHTLLLLLLALLSVASRLGPGDAFQFTGQIISAPEDQPLSTLVTAGEDSAAKIASAIAPDQAPANVSQFAAASADKAAGLLRASVTGSKPAQAVSQSKFQEILSATSNLLSGSFVSSGITGRTPEQRQRRAMQFGGTAKSEQAVEDALAWLAAHQLPSGAWSLVHDVGPCNGRCANPGSKERFDPAATGLALLAFMGAGYTHESGKYQDNVNRGVYYLYQIMEETREGGSFLYTSDRGMYNHGIAAFALCEAYQMTQDRDLEKAAQQAVDFIVSAQNYAGGWGYLPGQPGDLTISGWQVMALKSGHSAGLYIPEQVTFLLDGFLETQRLPDTHFYGYGKPGKAATCTSIGNLIRLFRGLSTTDPGILAAAAYFQDVGKSQTDVYYNYYVSLFLFHIGGPMWETWNTPVRDFLVKTQATTGHEAGSWYFENSYGKEGGRLYTTAMAAMTLEVYYRFSPLYQQVDDHFEL